MASGDLILVIEKAFNQTLSLTGPKTSSTAWTALKYPTNFLSYFKLFPRYAVGSGPAPDLSFDNGIFRAYLGAVFRWGGGGSAPALNTIVNVCGNTAGTNVTNIPYLALTPTVDDCLCLLVAGNSILTTSFASVSAYPVDTQVETNVSSKPISLYFGHVIQTAKATIASGNIAVTGGSNGYPVSDVIALIPGTGGTPTQTISDVNTTNHVTPGASATIHGTGFGASQGGGTVVLNQGSIDRKSVV